MPLLETINLCQRINGQDILNNINLKVEAGEVFALIGPTGAGKTTLLRLLNMLDKPSSGKVLFQGNNIGESAKMGLEIRRRMAFVLQKPVVFNLNVFENIAIGLKWRGLDKQEIRRKMDNVLEMVSLNEYQDRDARTLSGGETQRVAIARAIVTEPELLLLDEPTANLDPATAARVETLISDIIKGYNTTIIMATHDMSQGQRLADRVGVLIKGEIVQSGDWRQIFNTPFNEEVADLVGVENIIDGVVETNQDNIVDVKVGQASIQAVSDYPGGKEVGVCIRPEDVTLAKSKTSSSARNSFAGKIQRIVSFGVLSRVELDCGFPLVALVTKKSAEEMGLEKGKQVYASFKATAVHIINR
ncbi:MAG: ABC transporter ATP-binding protein [Dehalococcoidales bacterium]